MYIFLGNLFGWLFTFFAQWFTKRTAIQLGVVSGIVVLSTAVFASITALIASVSVVTPDFVQDGMNMCIPSNFSFCVSVLISAKLLRWAWQWKVHFIEMYVGN
jgi:hypothetical protein